MKSELIQKALDAGLYEYGHECCPLAKKWAPFLNGEKTAKRLIVAYNNSDYTFASLPVFTVGQEVLRKGLDVVIGGFGIEDVEIYLPEDCPADVQEAAGSLGTVVLGKVNVRETGPEDLIHHPETIANIGRIEMGESPAIFVKVKTESDEKTVILPLESTVADYIKAAGFQAENARAVVGGSFGTLLNPSQLNQPIYGYGNAIIEVFPEKFCPVSYAQQAAAHAAQESCGRCTFCREGNYQLSRFLKNAVTGHGNEEDISWLGTLAETVAEESVCSFGQESVRFLRDSLTGEKKSFDAHIRGKRCDSDVCQAFTDYAIDGSLCIGCDRCRQVCESGAIIDEPGYIHRIDAFDCTKCGKCAAICPEKAIYKVRVGRLIGPAKATKVGRYRTSRKKY